MTATDTRSDEQIAADVFARIQAGKVDGTRIPLGVLGLVDMQWGPLTDIWEDAIPQELMYPEPTARLDNIEQIIAGLVGEAGAAERAQMRDVLAYWRADRKRLSDHLSDAHGIWLTTGQFRNVAIPGLRLLDPCEADLEAFGEVDSEHEAAVRIRALFDAAEAWLLAGRERHVYEWHVGRCTVHGTEIGQRTGALLCDADYHAAERSRLGDLELAILDGTASDADVAEYRKLSAEHEADLLADLNRRLREHGEAEVATYDDVVPGSAAWRVAFGGSE